MSPWGYLSTASPQKVLVKPSPRARPMETLQWLPMARLLSQHPRLRPVGSAPCRLGLVFQRGPGHVPSSPLAPENVGLSPRAGKQWNRLERASLGSNPSPPSVPRDLRTATQPLWASNTPTLQERDGESTEATGVAARHRVCSANLSR